MGIHKDSVTVYFRRKADGEVFGEIMNDKGVVVASRSFGIMTEEEYKNALKHIEKEFPDACVGPLIELTGN